MPSDFAFSTAHTLSSRAADESKRPGSGWSYNNESTDPQNTTQEIATQRKRILSSQVAAAQQYANATCRRPRVPTEAGRRGQQKGVPNDTGEHDAAVRRDLPGELRLAAVVAGLAVLEAAAKSIAGVLEMVGAVAHVGQGDGGGNNEGFQRRRGAAVGSGSGWGDGLP
jgi:hypothetical protein